LSSPDLDDTILPLTEVATPLVAFCVAAAAYPRLFYYKTIRKIVSIIKKNIIFNCNFVLYCHLYFGTKNGYGTRFFNDVYVDVESFR
jgi:hypothetical protein